MFGSTGSWALSEQLALYRTLDTWDRNRADNSLALNDAAWRNQYNNLVNQYNRLLHDANRLADVQDRALNGKDLQIAELTATSESSAAQVRQLRQELQMVRGLLDVERAMYREKHPEDFE